MLFLPGAKEVKEPRPLQSWSAQLETLLGALSFKPEEKGGRAWIFIFISHLPYHPCRRVSQFLWMYALLPTGTFPARMKLPVAGAHSTVEPELLLCPSAWGAQRLTFVLLIVTSKGVHQR